MFCMVGISTPAFSNTLLLMKVHHTSVKAGRP